MSSDAVIGMDGGASLTRAIVLDRRDARVLARSEGGPALSGRPEAPFDIDVIEATCRRAARAAAIELPAAALCAGLAGVGRAPERERVRTELQGRRLAEKVWVVTDAEAAFHDAFADAPGLLLVAGTGSMAWGRGEDGRVARAGGWGLLLGDEGSGYDIGLRALRASARAADGRGAETELLPRLLEQLGLREPEELLGWTAGAGKFEIAALAPLVIGLSETGDGAAAAIVETAIASLLSQVTAVLSRLGPWRAPPGLALAGGLIAPGGPLRDRIVAALADQGCRVLEGPVEAARGAGLLALRELSRRPRS